ncbi:cell division protein FtsQ/DivIB [Halobacillus salinarum]|uniref:Cell division protein DivIB n=1 Tax=Halobacillus salinarum TaxID=2932257 RepID=A0ABY4EF87_9BACI|nr:cell division protein FtsQ/DivIB [Halobacillus salinarum]UOQ43133.1 cell division protein FtsQ/DivIB [Halobacillus salinarum]
MEERKVVSIEDRIPKLKQSRRKKANRRLILYLSILFLLIATVIYLQSPLSNVNKVVVKGQQHVSAEEIKKLSKITNKNNYWKIDPSEVEKRVKKHVQITNVQVSRRFPGTVMINVDEAERIGYIQKDGKFQPILEDGSRLSATSKVPTGDAPVLSGFTDEMYLKEISQELKKLPESITSLISEVHWDPDDDNPYRIRLYMSDGYEVVASIRNFSSKMPAYPSIVAQLSPKDKGIIHIDVGTYFEKYPSKEKKEENDEHGQG